jgi:predicted ATPase with chaperone activity
VTRAPCLADKHRAAAAIRRSLVGGKLKFSQEAFGSSEAPFGNPAIARLSVAELVPSVYRTRRSPATFATGFQTEPRLPIDKPTKKETDVADTISGSGFAAELIRQGVFDAAEKAPEAADRKPVAHAADEPFVPREPSSLEATGLTRNDVESLILKFLLHVGAASGRQIADQIKLPFGCISPLLQMLKSQLLVMYRNSAPMSDYEYELSETGLERARRFYDNCTYFGAAPVSLEEYLESVRRQSLRRSRPKLADICRVLDDLILEPAMISQLGQAVNAGLGLFLYGAPGNGKTSIAERLVSGLGQTIWIPRTIGITGEILRVFDPAVHEVVSDPTTPVASDGQRADRRWVRIKRPTVVVGGELTLNHLEITHNSTTGTNESPVQIKSNCGVLVVDDFGRQRVGVAELLNRWIVPLEKRFDCLSLPTGRQIQIPFEQLLVFATNFEPHKLVDEAFLRRIPYKIEVNGPNEEQFNALFRRLAPQFGFEPRPETVAYLLDHHYHRRSRPLRYCHVRDLLLQARSFCEFHDRPIELTTDVIDVAAKNYFAGL